MHQIFSHQKCLAENGSKVHVRFSVWNTFVTETMLPKNTMLMWWRKRNCIQYDEIYTYFRSSAFHRSCTWLLYRSLLGRGNMAVCTGNDPVHLFEIVKIVLQKKKKLNPLDLDALCHLWQSWLPHNKLYRNWNFHLSVCHACQVVPVQFFFLRCMLKLWPKPNNLFIYLWEIEM